VVLFSRCGLGVVAISKAVAGSFDAGMEELQKVLNDKKLGMRAVMKC